MNRPRVLEPTGYGAGWIAAGAWFIAISLLTSCAAAGPTPWAVECRSSPDVVQTLAQAWQAYQPGEPLSPAVNARRRLFAFQALLLGAGMYDEPPAEPAVNQVADECLSGDPLPPGLARIVGPHHQVGATQVTGRTEAQRRSLDPAVECNRGGIPSRRGPPDWISESGTCALAKSVFQPLVEKRRLESDSDRGFPTAGGGAIAAAVGMDEGSGVALGGVAGGPEQAASAKRPTSPTDTWMTA